MAKKVANQGGRGMVDLLSAHPWDGYNYAQRGLDATTMEEMEIYQCIRTPNIGREVVPDHDARLAIAWREGAAELDFGRTCFLSWNDRFTSPRRP